MSIQPEDLPLEIQRILGVPAREGASINEQPVCHPDFRVTAQLTDAPTSELVKPWRIVNARKGDLLLSPGGPSGMIGGLLKQLDDPQVYSHMGIMTEDEVEVRHTTAVGDRTMHDRFTTGNLLGEPAPTDGYTEGAIKYQWPGTITQTINQAYLTWRDHPCELDAEGHPREYESGRSIPDPQFSILDPVTNERWHIDGLSFTPEMMQVGNPPQWREVWPAIVKPCPALETTAVRRALHRIADAANEIRAHYRLFAYTRAAIARDPDLAVLSSDALMYEEMIRNPDTGCTGARPDLIPVKRTVPLVCSTFVWWAVQEANRAGGPRIVLDLRPFSQRMPDPCLGSPLLAVEPHPQDDRVDWSEDGLYVYTKAERERAGTWLHDYIVDRIRRQVHEAVPVLEPVGIGVLLELLNVLPFGTLSVFLGVNLTILPDIMLWLTDMADDVANQLCNTFAFDWSDSSAKDSDRWKGEPVEGLTVSPDDILNEWAPPQKADEDRVIGVYGYNEKMILRPPEWVLNPPPPSTWQISQGFATKFGGRVFYRDPRLGEVGVRGAHVRVGAHTWVTSENGWYNADMNDPAPTGMYWGVASYTHPESGLHLEAEGRQVKVDLENPPVDWELLFPPDSRREVWIKVQMTLINRHIIGHDWYGYPQYLTPSVFLDIDCFMLPDRPEFATQREAYHRQRLSVSLPVEDWGAAQMQFEVEIQADKSIRVTYRARLYGDEDDADWQATGVMTVPPKTDNAEPGVTGTPIDIMRRPLSPVRANIKFEVHNNRMP